MEVGLEHVWMRQVLVGRNNKENDRLSHVVAAKTDLWFHARGFPGSHTVLRLRDGRWALQAFPCFCKGTFWMTTRSASDLPAAALLCIPLFLQLPLFMGTKSTSDMLAGADCELFITSVNALFMVP